MAIELFLSEFLQGLTPFLKKGKKKLIDCYCFDRVLKRFICFLMRSEKATLATEKQTRQIDLC